MKNFGNWYLTARMNFGIWLDTRLDKLPFVVMKRSTYAAWLDMDYRFSCVLNRVTKTMSKTNYTLEAMYGEIQAKEQQEHDEAYQEGYNDYTSGEPNAVTGEEQEEN